MFYLMIFLLLLILASMPTTGAKTRKSARKTSTRRTTTVIEIRPEKVVKPSEDVLTAADAIAEYALALEKKAAAENDPLKKAKYTAQAAQQYLKAAKLAEKG